MISKERFEASAASAINSKSGARKYYSADEYEDLKRKVLQRQRGEPFENKNDYRKVAQFEIEEVDNKTRLRHRESKKILIQTEEYYDVLTKAHNESIHGGINVMLKDLRDRYYNINQEVVTKFVQLCDVCEMKRNKQHCHEVVKPILTQEFNGRCQVDLIDFQSRPDGEYKFVLVYQDHLTKYVVLRALKTKTMESIVDQLFPIFIDFGAPLILHTDNGREFTNKVTFLKKLLFFFFTIILCCMITHTQRTKGRKIKKNY